MSRLVDLSGNRFGKWLVIGAKPEPRSPSAKNVVRWLCRCDCGIEKAVEASSLKDGQSTNCGCSKKTKKHGLTGTPEYNSWNAMRQRCRSKPEYLDVPVCDRWAGESGFLNFLADMGPRPTGTTLDRRDGTRGYEPANCRWASPKTQTANRKNSLNVLFDGRMVSLAVAVERMARRIRRGDRDFEIKTLMPGSVGRP